VWVPIVKLEAVPGSSLHVLKALRACNNVAFTSPRAVRILLEDARSQGILEELLRELRRAFIAAIGPKTGEEVRVRLSRDPNYIASKHYSKSLVAELYETFNIKCLVVPRSSEGVRDLRDTAEALGIKLVEVNIYKPEPIWDNVRLATNMIAGDAVDIVLLSSPMIAKLVCESLSDPKAGMTIIAIGETTYKSMPVDCLKHHRVHVGDGSLETLKSIINSIC